MDLKRSLTIARKDLRIEFRSRQKVNLMIIFSFIILLMFNFAADPYSPAVKEVAPGLLWFIFIFTGLLGIPSSFTKELDRGTLDGLRISPLSYNELLLGKVVYNLVIMLLIELIALPLFIVLFDYTIAGSIFGVLVVLTTGIVGLVIIASFMSAVIMSSRGGELLLQILVLPLLLPVIIPTIIALREVMVFATPLLEVNGFWLVVLYIIIMTTLSSLLFSYVMEE